MVNVESSKIVCGSEMQGKEENVGRAEGIKWESWLKAEIDQMEYQQCQNISHGEHAWPKPLFQIMK